MPKLHECTFPSALLGVLDALKTSHLWPENMQLQLNNKSLISGRGKQDQASHFWLLIYTLFQADFLMSPADRNL